MVHGGGSTRRFSHSDALAPPSPQRINYDLPDPALGKILKMKEMGKFWRKRAEAMETKKEQEDVFKSALGPSLANIDTDMRCRKILRELDRATHCQKEKMDSAVLHGAWQRFHRVTLKTELGRDLEELLALQIKMVERNARAKAAPSASQEQKAGGADDEKPDPYAEDPVDGPYGARADWDMGWDSGRAG